MNRKEKDAIMNKLLYITGISIIASLALWFIYKGYMHTSYILSMPYILIFLITISALTSLYLGWKIYKNRKIQKTYIPYLIACIILTITFIMVYPYNVKYIYYLWWLIAINLIITFTYNIYRIISSK